MADPLEAVRGAAPGYLDQIQRIRASLTAPPAPASTAIQAAMEDVRRQAAAEIGGLVSEYFVGRRRPGQKIGRVLVDQGRLKRKSDAQAAVRRSAVSLLDRIGADLDRALEDPIDWQFQRHVRAEVVKARTVRRPLTLLDRIEGLVRESEAYSPPQDDISVIRRMDSRFRGFIRERLSLLGTDWWIARVPSSIRVKAERSMTARGSSHADPIRFLTFGDYGRIILAEANWVEAFQAHLPDRAAFKRNMDRLTSLRNDVAHSRPLSASERLELRQLAARVLPI